MSCPRYTTERISRIRINIYGIAGDDVFPEFIKTKEFDKFLEDENIEEYNRVKSHRILTVDFKTKDVKKVLKWLKKKGCKSPKKT
jgi:hypothetical protein